LYWRVAIAYWIGFNQASFLNFFANRDVAIFLNGEVNHVAVYPMEKEKIGEVFKYYPKIGVAAINLTAGSLQIGDQILIQGATTNLSQTVDSMEINKVKVNRAERGQSVGIKVADRVREGDIVYKA